MKKQLAIKGHETRGKEVIEILQMLGGKKTIYSGKDTLHIYSLDDYGEITTQLYRDDALTSITYDVFTLEEFLEKFPFKINDAVFNSVYNSYGIIIGMYWVSNERCVKYCVKFEDFDTIRGFKPDEIKLSNINLTDDADPLHELCESKTSTLIIDSGVCDDEVEIILNGYEIEVRNGKTFAVKKKPKYPMTYEECCGILGMTFDYPDIREVSDKEYCLYSSFIQLIRCRNAYWEIAGEEIGLGKPWEPTMETVYCISRSNNIIKCSYRGGKSNILEFPTAEMRDAFYENFKDLIEDCKELL